MSGEDIFGYALLYVLSSLFAAGGTWAALEGRVDWRSGEDKQVAALGAVFGPLSCAILIVYALVVGGRRFAVNVLAGARVVQRVVLPAREKPAALPPAKVVKR
jgi:hypothetical protein